MKLGVWFCLVLLCAGCMPDAGSPSNWDGTYIGYYHRNQQDTTPVTLTFEGKYFAAAPRPKKGLASLSGVFQKRESSMVFYQLEQEQTPLLHGTFQYSHGQDGSIRFWQDTGTGVFEMILRQQ